MIDKMARYEGATHIETIEMLTGLRYREGERSQGISTGDASPNLIRGEARGDIGIPVPIDKENRGGSGDKKKKAKMADEYVCTDCGQSLPFASHRPAILILKPGTLDSPEWRKGPQGPKTLCNACGRKSSLNLPCSPFPFQPLRQPEDVLTLPSSPLGKEREETHWSKQRPQSPRHGHASKHQQQLRDIHLRPRGCFLLSFHYLFLVHIVEKIYCF
jgi:hypothetical protein